MAYLLQDGATAAAFVFALFVVTFLLGSIPWGVIISKTFFSKDLRDEGSGNIGTTNAMRTMGKKGGAAVFVLDFGKGVLSGLLGFWLAGALLEAGCSFWQLPFAVAFAGCIWGHIFSPWLKFKGGKGIAVAVGCLFFVFGWWGTLLELGIFIVVVLVTRQVSAGSLSAAVACPFLAFYFYAGDWASAIIISLAALTIIWAHRENIRRLWSGTESKIGRRA